MRDRHGHGNGEAEGGAHGAGGSGWERSDRVRQCPLVLYWSHWREILVVSLLVLLCCCLILVVVLCKLQSSCKKLNQLQKI
jgi:hypothetical protein